jgi:TPR repeat protein
LNKEANNGDPFAQHELGIRYLMGRGFKADTAKAVYWIQKAASQKLATAEFNLGIMLLNGIGAPWNPFEAFRNFGKAAEAGMPEAAYIYGTIFTDNLVVNRNLDEAYKWVSRAADKGIAAAEKLKTRLEEYGVNKSDSANPDSAGTKPPIYDPANELISNNWTLEFSDFDQDTLINSKEKDVVEQLLKKKSNELKKFIGFSRGTDSLKDTTNIGILKLAARNGSPEALTLLGKTYELGINTSENRIKAVYYYLRALRLGARKPFSVLIEISKDKSFFEDLKKAVDSGSAEAMYVWAALTSYGFDFQLTFKQALDLLLKASEQNHIASLIETGIVYVTGTIVEKDTAKAIEFWRRAYELGSVEGKIRNIFLTIVRNRFNFKNSGEIKFLEKTANGGSVIGQSVLAYCYEHGYGVRQNKAQASQLYRGAAARGSEAAYSALKKMYDDIRPDDDIFQIYE